MRSMKGPVRALLVLACLVPVALPAAADRQPPQPANRDGIVIPGTDLVKTTVAVAGAELEIYAEPHVEVGRLLEGSSPDKAATTDDLYQRISASRKQLYGNAPLIVIGNPLTTGDEATVSGAAAVVQQYFWVWYKETTANNYFYTTCKNPSTATTLVITALDGLVDVYAKPSTAAAYRYLGRADGNDSDFLLTQYQTAKKTGIMGYAFIGNGESHIVVYCFK